MTKLITLNATVTSDLKWECVVDEAVNWMVDLGLFSGLKKPVTDEMQFKTLKLALEHFRDAIWSRYASETLSVCLYKGSADFSYQLGLDVLEARDVAANYLRLLASCLPEEMPLTLELDLSGINSLLLQAQLLCRESFEGFKLVAKNATVPIYWTGDEKIALCLPDKKENFPELEQALRELNQSKKPYRIIPESYLTFEWEGLDELIISQGSLDYQGDRKVQGFVAAGGKVISVSRF